MLEHGAIPPEGAVGSGTSDAGWIPSRSPGCLPTSMTMVALFALSFDLMLITGLASAALVVLCLRILATALSVFDALSGRFEDAEGRGGD